MLPACRLRSALTAVLMQIHAQSHGHPKHHGPVRDSEGTPLITLPEQQLRRTMHSEDTLPIEPQIPSDIPVQATVVPAEGQPDQAAEAILPQGSTDSDPAALEPSEPENSSSSSKPEEGTAAVALDDVIIEVASPLPDNAPPPPKQYTVPYDRTSSLDEILHSSVRLFGRASRRLLGRNPAGAGSEIPDIVPQTDMLPVGHKAGRRLAQHNQDRETHVRAALAETLVSSSPAAEGTPVGRLGEGSQPLFRSGFEEPSGQAKVLESAAVAEAVPEAVVGSQVDAGDAAAIVSGADAAQHEQMEV